MNVLKFPPPFAPVLSFAAWRRPCTNERGGAASNTDPLVAAMRPHRMGLPAASTHPVFRGVVARLPHIESSPHTLGRRTPQRDLRLREARHERATEGRRGFGRGARIGVREHAHKGADACEFKRVEIVGLVHVHAPAARVRWRSQSILIILRWAAPSESEKAEEAGLLLL